MDDNVAQFMSITDQSAEVSQGCLNMTEGDVMAAVNMFFENPEIANSFNHPPSAAATSSNAAPAAAPSRPQGASRPGGIGRQDNEGVIHIDDDDDDIFDDIPDESDSDLEPAGANNLQRIAQESDDAAMARRLQEEMYGGRGSGGDGALGPDGVRAPIGRTTETLIAPSGYGAYPGGDDDEIDDATEAALREMRRRAARPSKFQDLDSC